MRRSSLPPAFSSSSSSSTPVSVYLSAEAFSRSNSALRSSRSSKRPHVAGDNRAFFCLCLLYIPVTRGTTDSSSLSSPFSTLPPSLAPPWKAAEAQVTSCLSHQNKGTKKRHGEYGTQCSNAANVAWLLIIFTLFVIGYEDEDEMWGIL